MKTLGAVEDFHAQGFYLAGGTGLALQLSHRISEDLDFFTEKSFEPETVIRLLAGRLAVTVAGAAPGTLHAVCAEDVKTSFLYYPYRLLYPSISFRSCSVADFRDIAAMKLVALSQRGTKKDFVDLFFLLREKLTVEDLRTLVERKFTGVRYNWTHIIRSLGYFEEAENDPAPLMAVSEGMRDLSLREWREIKQFFRQLQKEALRGFMP
jgi:predicted nucleotidyltransferase component of viral defense system